MKYEIEIDGSNSAFVEAFLEKIRFIKSIKLIADSTITNQRILDSIEVYETKKNQPTPLNLKELNELLNA